MSDGDVRIGVACEDRGHFDVTTQLLDAEALTRHDWLDGVLQHVRSWVPGPDGKTPFLRLKDAETAGASIPLPDGTSIRTRGHIGGKPRPAEANQWIRVLRYFATLQPVPDMVLLVRDLDGRPERRDGMEVVRRDLPWPPDMAIVLATPQPEIEAWRVSGFEPLDAAERSALERQEELLSFDPRLQSHRLTAHPNDAATDAKRVLAALTGARGGSLDALLDRDRLRARGGQNHCTTFFDELAPVVATVFLRRPSRSK